MASPTPVLPEVGSTIVPPGFSFPSRSACSIIARPIRSLTEPPGLRNSSLARIRACPGGESRSSLTIGVPPTRSRRVGYSRGIAGKPRPLCQTGRALTLGRGRELLTLDQHHSGHESGDADADEHPEGQRRPGREGLLEVALPVHLDQVVEPAQENGRTEGYADRASDLLRGVDESRSESCLVVTDARQRCDRHRDEGERQPEADQEVARQ